MTIVQSVVDQVAAFFFDPNLRFSLLYLPTTVVIAFLIWRFQGQDKPFLNWLLPRQVYLHRSNLVDAKLFLANHLMMVAGVFGPVVFSPAVAFYTMRMFGGEPAEAHTGWLYGLVATVLIVLSTDFCKYWSHRLHHESRMLWPFHAVHHSAEVLTPLTLARSHPMETVVRNLIVSVGVGVVQGVLLFAVLGSVSILTIGGANALYFVFNLLGANLRHSHIWLSYGRVLEHFFISPAQHQVHHSVAVKHHNKNYGSIFAIWDWAFGTLYVPERKEDLKFGVSDQYGNPIEQPHPTLRAALATPFRQSWKVFKRLDWPSKNSDAKHPAE